MWKRTLAYGDTFDRFQADRATARQREVAKRIRAAWPYFGPGGVNELQGLIWAGLELNGADN